MGIDCLDDRWGGGSTSPQVAIQVFQASIYNSLAYVYEVEKIRSHEYFRIFLIVKEPSNPCRLSKHSLQYSSDLSTHHSVTLICVPKYSGGCGNKIGYEFIRDSFAQLFLGPGPNLGISGQNIMHKIIGWPFDQHLTMQKSY